MARKDVVVRAITLRNGSNVVELDGAYTMDFEAGQLTVAGAPVGLAEQTTITGDAPTLTLRTESDTSSDWGIINFDRIDADGSSVVPDNTAIGVINFRTPKTGGTLATLLRFSVSTQGAAGADGQGVDLTLEAFDESGIRRCQIGFDTGAPFGGKITIDGDGDLAMNGEGDVTLSAGNNLTLTANGGVVSLVGPQNLDDGDIRIVDNSDPTKKLKFEVSGITTATTRTVTMPDGDGTWSIKVAAPASAAAAGVEGMWAEDDSFLYICTATNTWKRVAIASW